MKICQKILIKKIKRIFITFKFPIKPSTNSRLSLDFMPPFLSGDHSEVRHHLHQRAQQAARRLRLWPSRSDQVSGPARSGQTTLGA